MSRIIKDIVASGVKLVEPKPEFREAALPIVESAARKMLAEKDLDIVLIATPEHAHYAIAMYAIRHGKHVYCQKPLCHTVNEVRLLTEEAAKYPKLITKMGHQGHSSRS